MRRFWVLGLGLLLLAPVRAGISDDAVMRSLDQDVRLGSYGPYRLFAGQAEQWRLVAQKGGPAYKSLFQKTSTQAALLVMRFRPEFRGLLEVQSHPWHTSIPTPLLLAMATGRIPLKDYFQQIAIAGIAPPLPQPRPPRQKPTQPQVEQKPEPSAERFALRVPTFFNPQATPRITQTTLTQDQKVDPESWAYQAMRSLKERGVLQGYPDGTFRGDRPVSRDEFAAGLNTALSKVFESFANASGQVTRDDLVAMRQLLADFKQELTGLSRRLDAMEGKATASIPATYRIVADLPTEAGQAIGQMLLEFPPELTPVAPEEVRLLVDQRPIVPEHIVQEGQQYTITLKNPAPPGTRITIEVQGIADIHPDRSYSFGVTILPTGDLPAYYTLPTQISLTRTR
ncbi:S-layer homology domain-containing protein [Anthocerotibacter panamensis]|uniref:S-layer homology domain-containing protein n=1 Tax=Anthocerotibacter panamensis TaxID=2857077 RepID=UPI001C401861|nr:S-layer homology domain-containing protein [Anthocerotibacter panamensis]